MSISHFAGKARSSRAGSRQPGLRHRQSQSDREASQLDQLKLYTKVVADTGDFESIREYLPQDATTNPSLILQALGKPQYTPILEKTIRDQASSAASREAKIAQIMDRVIVAFGLEILQIVPGRVSTETDARLSFDTRGSIEKAKRLIEIYESNGASRDRVLIKVASTWEGIQAARELEKEGIHCNLTLLFSLPQAVACADAKVQLISPFVGRIYDWFKAAMKRDYTGPEDPGVHSVRAIYNYFKKFGHRTEIMGASFRNVSQIVELAGCDLLTISPELLGQLAQSTERLERKLDPSSAKEMPIDPLALDEKQFRFLLNEDAMATEKTAQGIRSFSADIVKLEKLVAARLP